MKDPVEEVFNPSTAGTKIGLVLLSTAVLVLAVSRGCGGTEGARKDAPPAVSYVATCAPPPCRDEAMSVMDQDGQRIECSSERHALTFQIVEGRTFAFCRCGTPGAPAVGGALVAPPLGSAGKP